MICTFHANATKCLIYTSTRIIICFHRTLIISKRYERHFCYTMKEKNLIIFFNKLIGPNLLSQIESEAVNANRQMVFKSDAQLKRTNRPKSWTMFADPSPFCTRRMIAPSTPTINSCMQHGLVFLDFMLRVFFLPCSVQSLVKTLYVLICVSFNFHPFEIRLELWAYLRVRVAKIK